MYLKIITTIALTNTFITSCNYHFLFVVRTFKIYFLVIHCICFHRLHTHSSGSGKPLSLTAGSGDLGMEIFMHKLGVSAESEPGEGGSEMVTVRFWGFFSLEALTHYPVYFHLYFQLFITVFQILIHTSCGPKRRPSTFWFLESREVRRFSGFHLETCWLSGRGKSPDL